MITWRQFKSAPRDLRPDDGAAGRGPRVGFRGDGRRVLPRRRAGRALFIDNIFRFTQAGSEVSALLGRMPSAVGYQPTLLTEMGELQERITSTKNGSITSVQAIYVPADDYTDPAPATTFAHLDATTNLSRQIAELGIYPAVDPLASTSRILDPRVSATTLQLAARGETSSCSATQDLHHIRSRHRRAVERGHAHRRPGSRIQRFLSPPFCGAEHSRIPGIRADCRHGPFSGGSSGKYITCLSQRSTCWPIDESSKSRKSKAPCTPTQLYRRSSRRTARIRERDDCRFPVSEGSSACCRGHSVLRVLRPGNCIGKGLKNLRSSPMVLRSLPYGVTISPTRRRAVISSITLRCGARARGVASHATTSDSITNARAGRSPSL